MGFFAESARRRLPAKPSPRAVLLRKIAGRTHRYHLRRIITQSVSLSILFLIPLFGIARFDLWRGNHRVLGKAAEAPWGFTAVIAGIAGLYLVTFLFNFIAGRLFCGWGCPVGQLCRFGEAAEEATRSGRGVSRARLHEALFAVAFSASVLFWWVDPAILLQGTLPEAGTFAATLALLALCAHLHGRFWRWSFCRKVCPIGLYYSVVHLPGLWSIRFDRSAGTCKECRACERVCPVGLDPRLLDRPQNDVGGLAIDGLPGDNHCLRCADCVQACEFIFSKDPLEEVPLRFELPDPPAPWASPPPHPGS